MGLTPEDIGAAFGIYTNLAKIKSEKAAEALYPVTLPDGRTIMAKANDLLDYTAQMNKPTTRTAKLGEYDQYVADEKAAGRTPKPFDQWDIDREKILRAAGRSSTVVNMGDFLAKEKAKSDIRWQDQLTDPSNLRSMEKQAGEKFDAANKFSKDPNVDKNRDRAVKTDVIKQIDSAARLRDPNVRLVEKDGKKGWLFSDGTFKTSPY